MLAAVNDIVETKAKRARSPLERQMEKLAQKESLLRLMHETGCIRKVPKVFGNNAETADMMLPRPGPVPLSRHEKRSFEVCSRFNYSELDELDRQRTANGITEISRGEWLRMCWLRTNPTPKIPALNIRMNDETANAASNLVQISRKLVDPGLLKLTEAAANELEQFRRSLCQYVPIDVADLISEPLCSEDRSSRRGPHPLPADEVRTRIVWVALTADESQRLNTERGESRRGEWIRMVWKNLQLDTRVPTIPESVFNTMATPAKNINIIAHELNRDGSVLQSVIKTELIDFQVCVKKLKGALK